jgi:deoxyribodipyrimidine photolyase-related protein
MRLFLRLGNQLFDPKLVPKDFVDVPVFMAEAPELASNIRHHKMKVASFFVAMRLHKEELEAQGFKVHYHKWQSDTGYFEVLETLIKKSKTQELISYEIEDKFFELAVDSFCKKHRLKWTQVETPMFLSSRPRLKNEIGSKKKPFMKTFYESQRKHFKILVDSKGKPTGGKFSFDADNRKKLPSALKVPGPRSFPREKNALRVIEDVQSLVSQNFSEHPGEAGPLWMPLSRDEARLGLRDFLKNRLESFGAYEDAISTRSDFVFHSLLTPAINQGLLTPREVLDETLAWANKHKTPINSLEGFVRQILGWREFIRGIYQNFSEHQEERNFFNHKRSLSKHWWNGTTGIPPLDDAIKKAWRLGYCHHIERLMILSNMMLLCEIEPREAHRWFMEMFVDSSDWVMGPNVYGMGLFSDGGIFATKPYTCGSNYWLKMSDYSPGPWVEVVDGLYWSFIHKHKDYYSKNPRMKVMVSSLEKMDSARKSKIFRLADGFRTTQRFSGQQVLT